MYNYSNPDLPSSTGYDYITPVMTGQPNYQQQPVYYSGIPTNMAPQPMNNAFQQPQPMKFPDGTGTFGVEGRLPQQQFGVFQQVGVPMQQPMGLNQLAEDRRSVAVMNQQPQYMQQQQAYGQPAPVANFAQQGWGQPVAQYQPQSQLGPIPSISNNEKHWGPTNQYTQPGTPVPPTVNFQSTPTGTTQGYPGQTPTGIYGGAGQRPDVQWGNNDMGQNSGISPNWSDLARSNFGNV